MAERARVAPDQAKVTYRVATIAAAPDALWEVHGAEFAQKALAEEWAHYLLWTPAPDRPHHAALVPVVGGVMQVPGFMQGRLREEQGPEGCDG